MDTVFHEFLRALNAPPSEAEVALENAVNAMLLDSDTTALSGELRGASEFGVAIWRTGMDQHGDESP